MIDGMDERERGHRGVVDDDVRSQRRNEMGREMELERVKRDGGRKGEHKLETSCHLFLLAFVFFLLLFVFHSSSPPPHVLLAPTHLDVEL
jgi:hypothetical protein